MIQFKLKILKNSTKGGTIWKPSIEFDSRVTIFQFSIGKKDFLNCICCCSRSRAFLFEDATVEDFFHILYKSHILSFIILSDSSHSSVILWESAIAIALMLLWQLCFHDFSTTNSMSFSLIVRPC